MAQDHAPLLSALIELDHALADNVDRSLEIRRRIIKLHAAITAEQSVTELIENEPGPRSVELLSTNLEILEQAGSDFRINLARALRYEGMTIQAVADLFGVTRQRISALLRQHCGDEKV